MQTTNKKNLAAGAALVFAGLADALVAGPCPLCIASISSGAYVIKQNLTL